MLMRYGQIASAGSPVLPDPPAWLNGIAVNQWVELTGTASITTNYSNSGFAIHTPTWRAIKGLTGGHGVGLDNRVDALLLNQTTPAFSTLIAASGSTSQDDDYYPDGKPAARHVYWCAVWCPEVSRMMYFGLRFTYAGGIDFYTVDGLNLGNNTWDAAGTWADISPSAGFSVACRNETSGDVYCGGAGNDTGGAVYKWTQPGGTWTRPTTTQGVSGPMCWDSNRGQFFFICIGNGTGGGDGLIHHCIVNSTGATVTAVTFAAGDGTYAAFKTAGEGTPKFEELGMAYDKANDVFLLYEGGYRGGAGERGKVRRITPNGTTSNWGMDVLSTTGFSPATSQGMEAFQYVYQINGSTVSGMTCHPKFDASACFLRTT